MRNTSAEIGNTIHLDYASTTPIAPEVFKVMEPYFKNEWANANALYKSGARIRKIIEESRTRLARILRIRPEGIIFTSGGTESNNLALFGYIESLKKNGRAYNEMHIISTRIEHPSILEVLSELESWGIGISYCDLDEGGRMLLPHFETLIRPQTVLVTFAYVNSEIGVIQDVKRITRIVRKLRDSRSGGIAVHLDASQAPLWLSCEMDMLGVDLMTLDSGKCYGPKGSGVLALRHGIKITPRMLGGGQERGLRSSTENTPLIVGAVEAFVRAQTSWEKRSESVILLRDYMISLLESAIPNMFLNGSIKFRVANNINISITGIESEFAVITLDTHNIAAATKSACGESSSQGSHVVRAITNNDDRARTTIRFTLGESTKKGDLQKTVDVLKKHVEKMEPLASLLA